MGRKRQVEATGWAERVERLIAKHGEAKLIDLLATTSRTLKGWRYGEWEPAAAHQKLIELAESGKLK
jgi:hypothetical protein